MMNSLSTYLQWLEDGKEQDITTQAGADAFFIHARPNSESNTNAKKRRNYKTSTSFQLKAPLSQKPSEWEILRLKRDLLRQDLEKRFVIHPIVKTSRNPFFDQITIGRTSNNDLIFPLPSVSKFHAWIKTIDGYEIYDADSTFGTFINGNKIPAHASEGTRLSYSAEVVFGKIHTLFVEIGALRDWFVQLGAL